MNNYLSSSVRKKIFLFGMLLFVIVGVSVGLFLVDGRILNAASSKAVKATFNAPMSLFDLADAVKSHGVKITELYYTQGDIQGGYTVQSGETVDDVMNNFRNAHDAFLATAISKTEKDIGENMDTKTTQRLSILRNQLIFARSKTNKEGLKVDSIETNDEQSLDGLKKAGLINSVSPKESINHKISARLQNAFSRGVKKIISMAEASYWHEPWAPYAGGSDVQRTYTYQTFYFNSVSNFGSIDTYEHETQVYNKNFADYAGYRSSNMPMIYYDTPFLDSIDNFTVGTFNASSLRTYTQYYTYMTLRAGSASTATVRIKGQKGHRNPIWCYSTWCVWPDATTLSLATFTAPAGMSWQY